MELELPDLIDTRRLDPYDCGCECVLPVLATEIGVAIVDCEGYRIEVLV